MEKEREFKFTLGHFNKIKQLVFEHTGISFSDAKEHLVYGRLARRLRALDLQNFDEYLDLLNDDAEEEFGNFVNALTTNLTAFFREKHHFELLKKEVLPKLLQKRQDSRKLRIWSAGCSTGEEPYSLAITLLESINNISEWDIRILATDIDTNVLANAKSAIYSKDRIVGLLDLQQKKWFHKGKGKHEGMVKVKQDVCDLIAFKRLNLIQDWPMKSDFDIIFCRNVLIYFNIDTQKTLIDRYANKLSEDGYLFLGHSEAMNDKSTRFNLLRQTSYLKCA